MPKLATAAAAVLVAVTLALPVGAAERAVGDLRLDHLWTRATPPGAVAGGAYLVIENKGAVADRLVSGTAAVAGAVEIHEMAVTNGVMTMRPLDRGLDIPAGGKAELKPGGYHIMLIGLKQPLKKGEVVKATLVFEKAGPVEVEFPIEAIGATTGGHGAAKP